MCMVSVSQFVHTMYSCFFLKVVGPPPKFVFRVVSGPIVYTAISVINALQRSGRRFMSVAPNWITPDRKYQIHTGKCPFS